MQKVIYSVGVITIVLLIVAVICLGIGLGNSSREASSLKSDLAAARTANAKLGEYNKRLESDNAGLKKSVSVLQTTNSGLNSTIGKLKGANSQLESDIQRLTRNNQSNAATASEYRRLIEEGKRVTNSLTEKD